MLATSAICLLFLISLVGTQSIDDDAIGDYGNNTLVHPVDLTCPGLWSIFENTNGSSRCRCGSDLNRVVHCNKKTLQVKLLRCFCIFDTICKEPEYHCCWCLPVQMSAAN